MSGKIIIVGATGYTGAALARSFAKDEIDCHLISRNELELKEIAAQTGQSFSVCSDINNPQRVDESLKEIENDKVAGFAYCVGSIVLKAFQTTKPEDFINTFNLNVMGAIHFIKKLQKQLSEIMDQSYYFQLLRWIEVLICTPLSQRQKEPFKA